MLAPEAALPTPAAQLPRRPVQAFQGQGTLAPGEAYPATQMLWEEGA